MAKKSKKGVKVVLCVIAAAVLIAGSYYVGYTNHTSSIISAIPKQSVGGRGETPPPLPDSSGAPVQTPESKQPTEKPEESPEAGKYIGKSTSSAVEDTWSKIDSYKCDINSNGEDENIALYTSAESDNGEILWNDSQKWVLEVKSGDSYYILMNQNVSNGRVYFDVDETSDGTYAITVYTVSASGMNIKQYTYSKTGFIEKQIYSAGSVGKVHSGIPAYN